MWPSFFKPSSKDIKKHDREEDIESRLSSAEKSDRYKPHHDIKAIEVSAEPILTSLLLQAKDEAPAPLNAAGNPANFIPRQEYVMRDQYHEPNGGITTKIQKIINNIFWQRLGSDDPGRFSIIDLTTAINLNLVPDKNSSWTVAQSLETLSEGGSKKSHLSKLGRTALALALARPSASPLKAMREIDAMKKLRFDTDKRLQLQQYCDELCRGEKSPC